MPHKMVAATTFFRQILVVTVTIFEIQLSGGGGEFLTVSSPTVREYGKPVSYTFKGTTASDLRIVLGDDKVGIAEVKIEE